MRPPVGTKMQWKGTGMVCGDHDDGRYCVVDNSGDHWTGDDNEEWEPVPEVTP